MVSNKKPNNSNNNKKNHGYNSNGCVFNFRMGLKSDRFQSCNFNFFSSCFASLLENSTDYYDHGRLESIKVFDSFRIGSTANRRQFASKIERYYLNWKSGDRVWPALGSPVKVEK